MSSDSIEKLYKNFGILADAKDQIQEHSEEFLEILAAVKGSEKEKRLASQFITRFFKHFPSHSERAIEALLDLCEDEDVSIRKQAIKDLPSLCKDNGNYTQKIADILAQLLQAEDMTELSVVNNSLMTLIRLDVRGCLAGIFSQILTGEDFVREKCIKFLTSKVRNLGKDVLNKEAEDFVVVEIKKVLQDVTAYEFNVLMELLATTRLAKTLSGHQELVDLVCEQAEIDQPFNPTSSEETSELLDRLINCVRHALPYFSSQIPSTRVVTYICDEVLPRLDKIFGSEDKDNPIELELLKVFAELSTHCGALADAEQKVANVYARLLHYMPLPPEDASELSVEPRLEFSHVECLMYAFHRLARQCPDFVSEPNKLKDFKIRLQYFARGIQGYIKKLRETLSGKTEEELKSDENKLKVVALKTTSNINTLIKDLFHSPPSFKSVVSVSWKPVASAAATMRAGKDRSDEDSVPTATKRHTPITFDGDKSAKQKKSSKDAKELYSPPSGKYSDKVSGYVPGRLGRGRGTRGRFRGSRGWNRAY